MGGRCARTLSYDRPSTINVTGREGGRRHRRQHVGVPDSTAAGMITNMASTAVRKDAGPTAHDVVLMNSSAPHVPSMLTCCCRGACTVVIDVPPLPPLGAQ